MLFLKKVFGGNERDSGVSVLTLNDEYGVRTRVVEGLNTKGDLSGCEVEEGGSFKQIIVFENGKQVTKLVPVRRR